MIISTFSPPYIILFVFFSLILGMDPKRGELSRAMRNRCVEIFYDDKLTTDEDSYHLEKMIQSNASCGDHVEMSVVRNAINKSESHLHLWIK